VWIAPFHEDDMSEILGVLDADRLLFGSDYPHPEGLAEPCSFADHLPPGLPDADVTKIMGANLAGIMRVDQAA